MNWVEVGKNNLSFLQVNWKLRMLRAFWMACKLTWVCIQHICFLQYILYLSSSLGGKWGGSHRSHALFVFFSLILKEKKAEVFGNEKECPRFAYEGVMVQGGWKSWMESSRDIVTQVRRKEVWDTQLVSKSILDRKKDQPTKQVGTADWGFWFPCETSSALWNLTTLLTLKYGPSCTVVKGTLITFSVDFGG